MIDQFTLWLQSKSGEIEHVSTLLAIQLSGEPAELIEDLSTIEAWSGRVLELESICSAFLDRSKRFYLPTDPNMKETEKKLVLEAECADIKKTKIFLEGLSKCIQQRIMLGMAILKFEKPFSSPSIKDPNAGLLPRRTAGQIMRGE